MGRYAQHIITDSKDTYLTTKDDYIFYEDGTNSYLVEYVGKEKNLTLPATSPTGKNYEVYKYAFSGCTWLTSVTIGDSVQSIGDRAFYGCTSLKSVTIGENVKSIGDWAFCECTGLTEMSIPNSVESIGYGAFYGCTGLESITLPFVGGSVKSATDKYQYPFGYIFSTSSYTGSTEVVQSYYGSSTSSTTYDIYYIPSKLKSVTVTGGNILYGAFYGCSMLTSVTIPNSIQTIGDYAFCNCTGLISVTIPDSVESIGEYAFYYCTGLTSVTIGESVQRICNYAFRGCTGLTEVTIGKSVQSIGWYAFSGCTGLTEVTIGESVKSIGNYAFFDCLNLTIYCEAASKPSGWDSNWNNSNRPVVWNYKAE